MPVYKAPVNDTLFVLNDVLGRLRKRQYFVRDSQMPASSGVPNWRNSNDASL